MVSLVPSGCVIVTVMFVKRSNEVGRDGTMEAYMVTGEPIETDVGSTLREVTV